MARGLCFGSDLLSEPACIFDLACRVDLTLVFFSQLTAKGQELWIFQKRKTSHRFPPSCIVMGHLYITRQVSPPVFIAIYFASKLLYMSTFETDSTDFGALISRMGHLD